MSSIRLHREHGLNPTISQCYWCGSDKNEILLLGASYKGEAPRYMVANYEPCDVCKNGMAQGVTLMEAVKKPTFKNQQEMQEGVYPTGRWCVITTEAFARIFNVPPTTKAFLDVEMFTKLTEGT